MNINIKLNNKDIQILDKLNINEIIDKQGYKGTVAVLVNGKKLLLSEYRNYMINENDNIVIIKPLGGG